MPNRARGRAREQLTAVDINLSLMYCWKTASNLDAGVTGVKGSDLVAQLGHQVINSSSSISGGKVGIIGADAPKPTRMTKKDVQKGTSISTYCAFDKISEAIKNGWVLQKTGSKKGLGLSKLRMKVYVELGAAVYVWSLDPDDFAILTSVCGMKDASTLKGGELTRLVFGSSTPRPGTAFFRTNPTVASSSSATGTQSFSSYYSPDKENDVRPLCSRITTAVYPLFHSSTP